MQKTCHWKSCYRTTQLALDRVNLPVLTTNGKVSDYHVDQTI